MTDEDYEFNRIERESLMRMQAVKAAVPQEKDMSKEAMKLALEALERGETELRWKAITALREALTSEEIGQPAQQCRTDGRCQYAIDSGAEGMGHCPKDKCVMPEQPAQHQCKFPMCHNEEYQQALAEQIERELVGEQPAQRTWVGLTDEKIEEIAAITLFPIEFARAIETKLKEKNT